MFSDYRTGSDDNQQAIDALATVPAAAMQAQRDNTYGTALRAFRLFTAIVGTSAADDDA